MLSLISMLPPVNAILTISGTTQLEVACIRPTAQILQIAQGLPMTNRAAAVSRTFPGAQSNLVANLTVLDLHGLWELTSISPIAIVFWDMFGVTYQARACRTAPRLIIQLVPPITLTPAIVLQVIYGTHQNVLWTANNSIILTDHKVLVTTASAMSSTTSIEGAASACLLLTVRKC